MEEFYSIQGEGYYTGNSAYFLRIGGCDVGCHWCDVKESWNADLHPPTSIEKIVAQFGMDAIAITDNGTWGHVPFVKVCEKYKVKPILGVELPVGGNMMGFLAKNNQGLSEIYELVTFSYKNKLEYEHLFDVSENVIMLSGVNPDWGLLPITKKDHLYIEMSSPKALEFCKKKGFKPVATSNNHYPTIKDKETYEILVGSNKLANAKPITNEFEFPGWIPREAKENTHYIANECNATLPTAKMVSFISEYTLKDLCVQGAKKKGIKLEGVYKERLDTFTRPETRDYFQVIFKTYDKAEAFYNKILTNQNFIKYAKELNFNEKDIRFKDISKINLTKKLSKIIFKPTDNILLKPFQSNFGYHVVQILKINKETTKKLEEVSQSLTYELKYNLASDKLYEKIDLINDLAFSGNNLEEIIQLSKIKNLKINKISNLSKNGLTYIDFKPSKINLDQKFLNEVWNLQTNEISELFEINENEFILLNVDNEIEGRSLGYTDAKELIEEKIQLDTKIKETKLKSERDFLKPNLKKLFGLKRDQNQNLESFFTNNVLIKIFSSDTGKINSLETVSGILTYKVLKKSTPNKLNNKNIKEIDKNFRDELISDIQSIFYKSFETNQKIKTNLNSLNNLIKVN